MKKNGFTLIELLGVIIIISVITLLVFPNILNGIKQKQGDVDYTTNKMIISAAKLYVSDNLFDYKEVNGTKYCISIQTLIDNKYLEDNFSTTDQTKKYLTKFVQVEYNNSFSYNVVSSCTTSSE